MTTVITARIIIKKAMQKIGALVKSEDPAADEANDGLDALNAMVDSWSNDSLNIYVRTWESFSTVGGTASYTMGSGGAFNTVRPMHIIEAYIRSSTIDYVLAIADDQAYNSIAFKSLQGIPEFLNYDGGYPLTTIRLYPIPSTVYTLFMLSEKPLTSFATLDTTVSLPPGTIRALIYNLAIELAPEYSQEPTASVVKTASDSLGLIRTTVAKVRGMDAYPETMQVRNVFSGWWY